MSGPDEKTPLKGDAASETLVLERGGRVDQPVIIEDLRPGDSLGPFTVLGLLGEGGMGQVLRVHDPDLDRPVALKIIRADHLARPDRVARFLDEARTTARLQHPGIIPVHRLGQLPDGRFYFTMQEVLGKTLNAVIRDVHRASAPEGWGSAGGWTFRRMVNAFHEVCETVGYAHGEGILHRDLKPSNVMVGEHGEVMLLDWGIARSIHTAEGPGTGGTESGEIAGTPAWMAPEQARGVERPAATADVWALGGILYTLLHGVRPYARHRGLNVLQAVIAAPPTVPEAPGPPVPTELDAIWRRCMRMDPTERYRDANALAADVLRWLDGSSRREEALDLVARANIRTPLVETLRAKARTLRMEMEQRLQSIPRWAAETEKAPVWALGAQAAAAEEEADLVDIEVEQMLLGAVAQDPDLLEGHLALADRWRRAHGAALSAHDARQARHAEAMLRVHVAKLPQASPARRIHEEWLRGEGTVRLGSLPPGVPGRIERYVSQNGRLIAEHYQDFAATPVEVRLPVGSWRVAYRLADGREVYVPFVVERGEPFTSQDVVLPLPGDLGPDDVFVAAGHHWRGGDPHAVGGRTRARAWLDAFVIRRHPVTNTEFLAFLHDLVATGREDEALGYAPRERGGTVGHPGALIYGYERGQFFLRADADGDVWQPDWPVMMVDWMGASAYASWYARKTQRPWRLPTDAEWGKAARGVDGRFHPWGDSFDPSWCNMVDSRKERPYPVPVHEFPLDESPYGVRGLGGNVRDWCADADPLTGRRYNRGGFWIGNARDCRSADRHMHEETHRAAEVGFRLARSS